MVYTIDEIKEKIRPIAEKYNLPAVYLFGSYARGEADEKSDIDIIADCSAVEGLLGYIAVFNDMKENLSKEIDMIETDIFEREKDERFLNNLKRDMVNIYAG
jgi:predicted nucleotidyltransferase